MKRRLSIIFAGFRYTPAVRPGQHLRHALRVVLLVWLLTGSVPVPVSSVHVRAPPVELDMGWLVLWRWGDVRIESFHATERGASVLYAVLMKVELDQSRDVQRDLTGNR